MSKFSSSKIRVERPAADISNKFSDLSHLQAVVDQLPEDERAKLGEVAFSKDSIAIKTAQVGEICFDVVERTNDLVKFKAAGAPVDVELLVDLDEVAPESTDVGVSFEVQIPMMLRPLIAPHMQKAVDMLAGVIANVASK